LREKFSEEFVILDKRSLEKAGDLDKFMRKNPRLLVSIDFARQETLGEPLARKIWDLVVFDEAHRLRRDRQKVTQAYAFAEKIALHSKSLLLLSATPFSGKIEELYFLLALLDRGKLGSLHSFVEEYLNRGGEFLSGLIRDVTIRRTKKQVGGFTRRHAATTRYRLTKTEQAFYDRMSDYVRTEWRKAMEKAAENAGESARERNPRALLLTFYQKMMDSSLAAIRSALSGRVLALETTLAKNKSELAKLSGAYSETFSMIREEMDEGEEESSSLPESTREARENLAEVETELILTRKLYEESLAIKDNTKADTLRRLLDKIFSENREEKVVIFTQFKSTLADIQRIFPDKKISVFHGSLSREEKDAAILDFKNRTQILVCTEAGGEGRNLQFARILINYDLPWNPFRIEQRIGRIHRFGQKFDVQIYNFAMEASIGERILEILSEKIKIFEDAFGETDALLGMVDGGGKTIEKLFMRLAMDSKSADPDKTARAIQEHLKDSREKMDKLSGSLAISSQYLQEKPASPGDIKKEIRRLSLKLESFFLDYAKAFPEDFQILETKGEAGRRLFRIDSPGAPVEAEWVSFDYETAEG
ncbi:MAG: DEAD/DEAH box helicase, partial [Spirochaetia bacterium]|nr:DEAD/DEAH box helicase [Spirochaetia bacterium]